MESIDKITLELLTNKHQYNKYLSKEDPKKYRERQEYLEKIRKYKSKILNLSKQFLENPETSFNLEMNEMFSIFAKTTIRYIEMRELENENQYNNERENSNEDEETLFGKIDECSVNEYEEENSESKTTSYESEEKKKSYWGKNITKQTIPKYTMDMFMNTRHGGL
jgi:hypothetical protein